VISGSSEALPRRSRRVRARVLRPEIRARLRISGAEIALGIIPAAALGFVLGHALDSRLPLIAFLVVIGTAALLFTAPRVAAVALGASIPALQDLTGGRLAFHVAASDIVLVAVAARILGDAALSGTSLALRALRPLRFPALQYVWFVALLLAIHPGVASIFKGTQRLELLLLPLLVGAYAAIRREHMLILRGYVLAATLVAVAWPLGLFHLQGQLQKNPTGQLLANAILLLIGIRSLRRFLPCVPVLVVGLFLTASRGAILALLVGVAVIAIVHSGRNLRRMAVRTLPIALTALVAFHWLPTDVRSHVSELSASSTSSSSPGYSIYLRAEFQHEAAQVIAAHPWVGTGVGNYHGTDATNRILSLDPHNVILLQAAEGGYLFAVSFGVLILGAVLALWRLRRIELAAAAMAVLVATFAHGLVDVYWVRGTPVLGWLLVGVVCGLAWRERREAEA
jgi:hypothetical protein